MALLPGGGGRASGWERCSAAKARAGPRATRTIGPRPWRHDDTVTLMFDHVTIRVAELPASERFYRTTLEQLGSEPTHVGVNLIEWNDFSIMAADGEHPPTRHLHVAFVSPTREDVEAVFRSPALESGSSFGCQAARVLRFASRPSRR